MTPPNAGAGVGRVTQADRIASADLFGTTEWSKSQYLSGKYDKKPKVLRVARHREEAQADLLSALKLVVQRCGPDASDGKIACAAIARATGGEA